MKWYKKQLDALKQTQKTAPSSNSAHESKNNMATSKHLARATVRQSGGSAIKKAPNPVAKRNVNRPKTDSK